MVYVSEPNPARRARAEALEVATVLDPNAVDVPELLRDETGGLGVDVAIECSGHPSGFAAARALRPLASIISCSVPFFPTIFMRVRFP